MYLGFALGLFGAAGGAGGEEMAGVCFAYRGGGKPGETPGGFCGLGCRGGIAGWCGILRGCGVMQSPAGCDL